jgi:plastocyanin/heme-degrading monooxygenase HmoA
MDYAQTVLATIAAGRVEEATASGGLMDELNTHRDVLREQPGFHGMRVTRSANPEGDVLLVVETRWSSSNARADYESAAETVGGIVERHAGVLIPGTVQVQKMETVASEPREAPTPVYGRLWLALLVPLGVLAFSALVIYLLSRIYLAIPANVATPLAAVIALGILFVAWYLASNPNVPRWQMGAIVGVTVFALAAGGVIAAVYDETQDHEVVTPPPATPVNGVEPPTETDILMGDNWFEFMGEREPTISIPAGEEVTFEAVNVGAALHNVHVADLDGNYEVPVCDPAEHICTDPAQIFGGDSGTLTFTIDEPGQYDFRCDFHPVEMVGVFDVQ